MKVKTIGSIGIFLTSAVWLFTSWRIIAHTTGCTLSGEEDRPHVVTGLTRKRVFHGLLWITMLMECSGYFMLLCSEWHDEGRYILYNGRSVLEFGSFSLVTILWFKPMANASNPTCKCTAFFCLYPLLLGINSLVLLALGVYMGLMLFYWKNYSNDIKQISHWVEGISWILQALIVLYGAVIMHFRLRSYPNWINIQLRQKTVLMTQILFNWIIPSALCYILRGTTLVIFFRVIGPTSAVYWTCAVWIPMVIPSLLLLYALRRRDRVMAWVEGISDAGALPDPTPPEEVFLSFHKTLLQDEEPEYDEVTEGTQSPNYPEESGQLKHVGESRHLEHGLMGYLMNSSEEAPKSNI